jgi:hypothetical protein
MIFCKNSWYREKLSSVKADVESVEHETEANMHSLLLMDRSGHNIPISYFTINEYRYRYKRRKYFANIWKWL